MREYPPEKQYALAAKTSDDYPVFQLCTLLVSILECPERIYRNYLVLYAYL